MVREIYRSELHEVLNLYLDLHEEKIPENGKNLEETWNFMIEDKNHHLIVNEVEGKIVSSCVCVIIPNLTRNVRPYAFIENVVTREAYRGNGYATECLDYAKNIYFNGIDKDFRKSDEAMRIRKTENLECAEDMSEKEISLITYKGPKLDQVSMTRQELELEISDFDSMKQILLALGFRPVSPVIKVREEYQKDRMTACLDCVEGLGDFLELEILVEREEDYETALASIKNQLKTFGYGMENTTNISYLSMLEQKENVG